MTTSGKTRRSGEAEARAVAERLGVPFVPHPASVDEHGCLLVLRGDGIVLADAHGSARWTGGMADLRIHRLDTGVPQPDHVLVSGDVREGDHVLDCTLGRAHDALVLERAVGPRGRVVGIEASLPLFAWTSEGLRRRGSRIECVHGNARDVLRAHRDRSFDVVFFDPMFDRRAHHEAGFDLVKRHGVKTPLDAATLDEARRIARRWVVVKAAPQSGALWRLGLETIPFRRNAELRFGRLPAAR